MELTDESREDVLGTYVGDFGTLVTITADGSTVHLIMGQLDSDLIPLTHTAAQCTMAHGDVEVQFDDRGELGYRRVTVSYPFFWVVAYRQLSSK